MDDESRILEISPTSGSISVITTPESLRLQQEVSSTETTSTYQDVVIRNGLVITSSQLKSILSYNPKQNKTTNYLEKYANMKLYHQNKNYSETIYKESEESTCGYLDMGLLRVDEKVIIRMMITNETAHPVRVYITTSGFGSDATVTSLPKIIAPGLSFYAYIAFTVEAKTILTTRSSKDHSQHVENTFALVKITSQWPLDPSMKFDYTCPVFFRVIPQDVTESNSTKRNRFLQTTMIKYPCCNPVSLPALQKRRIAMNSSSTTYENFKWNESRRKSTTNQVSQQDVIMDQDTFNDTISLSSQVEKKMLEKKGGSRRTSESTIRSAALVPKAPSHQMSSSSISKKIMSKRRFSMSTKVLVKHRKQTNAFLQPGIQEVAEDSGLY